MGNLNNDRDGFKFAFGPLNKDVIMIEDNRVDAYIDYSIQNNIKAIYFNFLYYKLNHVDCLKKLSNIESVNINSAVSNFDGLYNCSESIKDLVLGDVADAVDLSKLRTLRSLAAEAKHVFNLVRNIELEELRLWKYKQLDLNQLPGLPNLKTLVINQSPIVSLNGCNKFDKLLKIELNYLSKLEDIESLEYLKETLVEIRIESCKKIKIDVFKTMVNVEKLIIADCGTIPNLKFIENMPKLKYLVFLKTNVADGDLSLCKGMEYLAFDNKKHYSHKLKDFENE